jgi:peptide/nickel transport system permease protein
MRLSLLSLSLVILVSLAAPILAPFDPMSTTAGEAMQSPGSQNLLGTDLLGRDVLSRVLYGGQRTLQIAALATVIAIVPGLAAGLIAGTLGSHVDRGIMVIVNSLLAIPPLVIALVTLTLLGQGSGQLAIAAGIAQIAAFAQVTRSATKAARSAEYVQASHALGATRWHIMIHHVLLNIRPALYSYAGVVFAYSILNSAALSFLGLGGDPGVPDWGTILADGRLAFQIAPWVAIAPGVMILITVMSMNSLADHLSERDWANEVRQSLSAEKHIDKLIRIIRNGRNSRT